MIFQQRFNLPVEWHSTDCAGKQTECFENPRMWLDNLVVIRRAESSRQEERERSSYRTT
jgi:hypothetical protein